MAQADDKTVFLNLNEQNPGNELPSSIRPVTPSQEAWPQRNMQYLAQQTSLIEYAAGLNPLVSAAVSLLLTIVRLRGDGHISEESLLVTQGGTRAGVQPQQVAGTDTEALRTRLEAEIRGFETQALASEIENAQVLAARYLLCTAVDEAITTSSLGTTGEWSKLALLSTFHNETWGGEKFFQILERCMQQPARNLYLLELMYLLISLGFEGKYRVADRGAIAIESHRDKIYRQIKLLRGDPHEDLAKKVEPGEKKSRIYAYIPAWLVIVVVGVCVAATLFGFSTVLDHRAEPILEQLENVSVRQGGQQ